MIYFAGHGTAHGTTLLPDPARPRLCGGRTALTATGFNDPLAQHFGSRTREAFEGIDAGQLLMVLDACNCGQALEAEEKRRGPMNSKGLAQLAYEKGMYILTAAQSYQAALEAAQLGHGYLTYALVEEGLKSGCRTVNRKTARSGARVARLRDRSRASDARGEDADALAAEFR